MYNRKIRGPNFSVLFSGGRVPMESARVLVGRASWCQVRIDHPSVSREHAEIRLVEDHIELIDLGSLNGTMVNGERVRRRKLDSGDVVAIGVELLQVFSDDELMPAGTLPGARPMVFGGEGDVDQTVPTNTNRAHIELIELMVQGAARSTMRADAAPALCRAIENLAAYLGRSERAQPNTERTRRRLGELALEVASWFPDGTLNGWQSDIERTLRLEAELSREPST